MKNDRKGLWYASIAGTFAAAIALAVALPGPSFAQGSSGSSGGSAASDSSGQSDGAAGSSSGGSAASDSSGQSDGASGSSPSGAGTAAQDSSGQSDGTAGSSGQASGDNESTMPGSGTAQSDRMSEPGQSGSTGSMGSAGTAGSSTGTQSAMTADELQGKSVMTSTGEDLGEIDDVVIEQGQVKAALVDVGGFLGIGAKRVAIPQEQLSVQGDNVQTTMTEEEIAALPEYEEGQGSSGSMGTGAGTGSGTSR